MLPNNFVIYRLYYESCIRSVRDLCEESGYYFSMNLMQNLIFLVCFTSYTFNRGCNSTEVNSKSRDTFSRVLNFFTSCGCTRVYFPF